MVLQVSFVRLNIQLDESVSFLDDDTQEQSSPHVEENLDTQIDHTLINALSASREKFPTSKKVQFFHYGSELFLFSLFEKMASRTSY